MNLIDLPVLVCRMQKNRKITCAQLEVMGNSVLLDEFFFLTTSLSLQVT